MRSSFGFIAVLAVLAGLVIGLGCYTFLYAKGYSYLTNNPAACTNCHDKYREKPTLADRCK